MPLTPLKPLQNIQPFRIRRDCPDFTWESQIPTRLQPGQEYPDCVHQLSQVNEQRNIYLLTLERPTGGGGGQMDPP